VKINKPELFFAIFILISGILLIFVTPFGAGADEETHIGRIWEMSTGVLVPNRYLSAGPNYPFSFYQLSYRQDLNLNPVTWDTWKIQLFTKIDWDNFINYNTRTRYFPTLYLPQAFIMGIMGRVLDIPVGFIYYVIRLSYLIIYAAMIYLAVRIVPVGKWVFGILSVTPMSLIQASSISPDSVNNGIAFIFIAWVLYLNSPAKKTSFSRKDWYITAFLTLSICTLKLNTIPLLFILFLIPRVKYGSRKWLISFIAFTLISFVVVSLGWNYLTASELLFSTTVTTYNASEQLKGILADPAHFLIAIVQNIQMQLPKYLHDWVGVSGYEYWQLPGLVYWITPLMILLAVLSDSMGNLLNLYKRIVIAVTFVIVFLGTIILFYLLYNPPGTFHIPGIQGRYFLFIGPLLMFALLPNKAVIRLNNVWLQAGSGFVAFLAVGAFFLAYHVTCGSAYYSLGLCNLPRFKNWSPETSVPLAISQSKYASQTFSADCNDLAQIKLWIRGKAMSSDPLLVKVQSVGSRETVVSRLISTDTIPPSGWLEVDFSPIPDSRNKKFILEVSPTDGMGQPNIEMGYSIRNEYLGGSLSINNETQTGDLLFRYGCLVGLEKLFYPIWP